MYQAGNQPAYIELRVQTADTQPQPRGYILISLTQEDRPIPEFATAGVPKTDRVLTRVAGGQVARFLRYVPAYLAAEDAAGNLLGYRGTTPFARPDIASSAAGTAIRAWPAAVPIRAADAAPSPRVGRALRRSQPPTPGRSRRDSSPTPDRLKICARNASTEASAAWGLARQYRHRCGRQGAGGSRRRSLSATANSPQRARLRRGPLSCSASRRYRRGESRLPVSQRVWRSCASRT